jgi:VanZ family protein
VAAVRIEILKSRWVQAAAHPESRFSALWPLLFCAAGIFILSSIPGNHYPNLEVRFIDKWMHFLMYLPLGLCAVRYFWRIGKKGWLWPLGFGIIYGATDEWHQHFVPKRSCSLSDCITDIAAVATALCLWKIVMRLMPRDADADNGANRLDAVDWAA